MKTGIEPLDTLSGVTLKEWLIGVPLMCVVFVLAAAFAIYWDYGWQGLIDEWNRL